VSEPKAVLLGSALWRRTDTAMFESCRLSSTSGLHLFEGTVLTLIEGQPAEIRYEVIASPRFESHAARIQLQRGHDKRTIEVSRDGENHWAINGTVHPEFDGLIDLDLGFSPATNTLAIRRLGLAVGESAELTAVWLRFPALDMRLLTQSYTRTDEYSYRYQSREGEFTADLSVDEEGMVINYDKYWLRVE
jgi:uncharacterized protein